MSREELAAALRKAMAVGDLSYKEAANMASRSVTTIQNVLYGKKVSNRTMTRIQIVFSINGKSL